MDIFDRIADREDRLATLKARIAQAQAEIDEVDAELGQLRRQADKWMRDQVDERRQTTEVTAR